MQELVRLLKTVSPSEQKEVIEKILEVGTFSDLLFLFKRSNNKTIRIKSIEKMLKIGTMQELLILQKISMPSLKKTITKRILELSSGKKDESQTKKYDVFIVHDSRNKLIATAFKQILDKRGYIGFVAHEDMEKVPDWKLTWLSELENSKLIVALLDEKLLSSSYSNFELGYGHAKKIDIYTIALFEIPKKIPEYLTKSQNTFITDNFEKTKKEIEKLLKQISKETKKPKKELTTAEKITEFDAKINELIKITQTILVNTKTFEEKVITLLQENKHIDLDKLFEEEFTKFYNYLKKDELELNEKDPSKTMSYYKNYRKRFANVLTIIENTLKYKPEFFTNEHLEQLFRLEKLTHHKSGTTAIIEIPTTLLSEAIITILPLAYNQRKTDILKTLLEPLSPEYSGRKTPVIFDSRIWHPELFHRDIFKYLNYIYPKETREGNTAQKIKSLNEITYIYNCLAQKHKMSRLSPYVVLDDINTIERVHNKLEDPTYSNFVKEITGLDKKEIKELTKKRLTELYHSWNPRESGLETRSQIYYQLEKLEKE